MSWTLIEHQALSSSVASVTLGSGGTLPQTYKTLKLLVSARGTGGDVVVIVKPNNSSTGFSLRQIYGDGSAAASATGTDGSLVYATAAGYTANTFSNSVADFPNYTSTTANKPASSDNVVEGNQTTMYQAFYASLWSNTSAITSLVLVNRSSDNFATGSTFTLYGLA